MMTSKPYLKNTGKRIPALLPNTSLSKKQAAFRRKGFIFLLAALFFSGCVSSYTYPAAQVPQTIEKLCLEDYQLSVNARVVGKTVGALLYVDELIDTTGQIPKEVHEKMGRVLQVLARVALSTDLPIDFCSIVLRDKKSNNELTITRSIEDTRRANAEAIGVEESINRTLFGQGKYVKDALGNSPFILKEIRLENFLAEQIVQRIRYGFAREASKASKEDEGAEEDNTFILVDGVFETDGGKKDYRFSILSMKSDDPQKTMLNVFKTVNEVLMGYKFTGFDQIEIQDYLNRQKFVMDREALLNYQKNKIKDDELVKRFMRESQSVQEAFKLFGFAGPNSEPNAAPNESAATAPNP